MPLLHHQISLLILDVLVLTPLDRAAITRAFKAGRDTGDESDPLAQAEAALQVHSALLPTPPPRPRC
jgi:hypothetical protein